MPEAPHHRRAPVSVPILDEDPALAAQLSPEELAQARQYVRARTVTLMRGAHDPSVIGGPELLGLLVLDGWMVRSVVLAGRTCGTLIEPGALIRPWDDDEQVGVLPFDVAWRALQPTRLALLDRRTMAGAARWPAIMHALFRRSAQRTHVMALLAAIRSLQHVELRLQALMWLYADRYGQPCPDGMVLPVRLSHQDLADLVGSQRPSVSAHLGDLAARGEIARRPDRTWLLRGSPPVEVHDLRVRSAAARSAGSKDSAADLRARTGGFRRSRVLLSQPAVPPHGPAGG